MASAGTSAPPQASTVIVEGYSWTIGLRKYLKHAGTAVGGLLFASFLQWASDPANAKTLLGTSPYAIAAATIFAGAAGAALNYRKHKDDVTSVVSTVPLDPPK